MPAIVLQTDDTTMLCFLLVAGDASLHEGADVRDCILTGPPADAELIDHPLTIARTDFLHVEHAAKVATGPDGVQLAVSVADAGTLRLSLPDGASGVWSFDGGGIESSGKCQLAKPREGSA